MNPSPKYERLGPTRVGAKGRELLAFAGCDYLGLSFDPKVIRAAQRHLACSSVSTAASRTTTGNDPAYVQLEATLAWFFGVKEVVLTPDGYLANMALCRALRGRFTTVYVDEFAHASLLDSARLLAVPVKTFLHRDKGSLVKRLGSRAKNVLILTDSVFPATGALAPLREIAAFLGNGSMLLVDECHAVGVLGKKGRGLCEELGLESQKILRTFTLAKAFGVSGGGILAPAEILGEVRSTPGAYTGSTPIPSFLAAAAIQAIKQIRSDPHVLQRLQSNVAHARRLLNAAGISVPSSQVPIIALQPASAAMARRITRRLSAEGILPSFIQYAGGPMEGYFRFALSAAHTRAEIACLAKALAPFAAGLISLP